MNENTIISLLIAIVPSYLSYNAGKRKTAIEREDSATSHWQKLYQAMQEERDDWKTSSQSQQEQINELKKEISTLRGEIYKIKQSYEDRIEQLKEENNYLKNENERLESELIDMREDN